MIVLVVYLTKLCMLIGQQLFTYRIRYLPSFHTCRMIRLLILTGRILKKLQKILKSIVTLKQSNLKLSRLKKLRRLGGTKEEQIPMTEMRKKEIVHKVYLTKTTKTRHSLPKHLKPESVNVS